MTSLPLNSTLPPSLFNQKQKSWSRRRGGRKRGRERGKKKKATRSGRATTSVERETAEEGNTVEEQKGRKTSSVE